MSNDTLPERDSRSVTILRRLLAGTADRIGPVMDLYRPYVDGLENLPPDGRFLLVGNHTQAALSEIVLIPYFVRVAIGTRVRPLADRQFSQIRGPQAAVINAYGAVVGTPENARELMRENETILVFPGGGREMPKFRGEEYTLRWDNRYGFARLAIEHGYPIVAAGLVGGDDVYTSLTTRDSRWGHFSGWLGERLSGRPDMAMPLARGVGPTLIPRPQRMYLRFSEPIDTNRPRRSSVEKWVSTIKNRSQTELENALSELQQIRDGDPFRELNPRSWRAAVMPSGVRRSG